MRSLSVIKKTTIGVAVPVTQIIIVSKLLLTITGIKLEGLNSSKSGPESR